MINIAGSATFSFKFPAPPELALDFFADIPRLITHLSYIDLMGASNNGLHRVRYETVEMNAYTIRVLCDVRLNVDRENRRIHIAPVSSRPAIPSHASFSSTEGRGLYENVIRFVPEEESSKVEMRLKLNADLPRPHSMKLMPGRTVNKIAHGITHQRIREIAESFVKSSVNAYPSWRGG